MEPVVQVEAEPEKQVEGLRRGVLCVDYLVGGSLYSVCLAEHPLIVFVFLTK